MFWTLSMLDIAGHWNLSTQVRHLLHTSWSMNRLFTMAPVSSLLAMSAHSRLAMITDTAGCTSASLTSSVVPLTSYGSVTLSHFTPQPFTTSSIETAVISQ